MEFETMKKGRGGGGMLLRDVGSTCPEWGGHTQKSIKKRAERKRGGRESGEDLAEAQFSKKRGERREGKRKEKGKKRGKKGKERKKRGGKKSSGKKERRPHSKSSLRYRSGGRRSDHTKCLPNRKAFVANKKN